MNKKTIFTAIGLVLIIGTFFLIAMPSDKNSNSADGSSSNTQGGSPPDPYEAFLGNVIQKGTVDAKNQSEVGVEINDFYYDATVLTIKKGTKVTWSNEGKIRHNVFVASNSPNDFPSSELLGNGETHSYTFDDVGEYFYFCSPHPTQMRAIIKVVD